QLSAVEYSLDFVDLETRLLEEAPRAQRFESKGCTDGQGPALRGERKRPVAGDPEAKAAVAAFQQPLLQPQIVLQPQIGVQTREPNRRVMQADVLEHHSPEGNRRSSFALRHAARNFERSLPQLDALGTDQTDGSRTGNERNQVDRTSTRLNSIHEKKTT